MMQDYDGDTVFDAGGSPIGTVQRTYVDDSGTARFVEVAMNDTRHLVPVDGITPTDAGLSLPFTGQAIEQSPDASGAEDALSGDLADQVRAYFAGLQTDGSADTGASVQDVSAIPTDEAENAGAVGTAPQAGQVRDLGDVIEVPIVEEVLVKRPVVKEVLRIRKRTVSEERSVQADLRKEDVEVEEHTRNSTGDDLDRSPG